MKRITSRIKSTAVTGLIAAILLSVIIAVPGCGTDGDDITKSLNTYATEDTSYITKLADYKNFTIKKDISANDAEVNDKYLSAISELASKNDQTADPPVIDPLFTKFAELNSGEGTVAEDGDFICFDYDVSVDGEALSGGKASYVLTWLGSGNFIPGFDESIIGHEAGTEFPITVTFHAPYPQNTDLENKEAVFVINLRYIFPRITDDSVKVLLEFAERSFEETKVDESAVFEPSYTDAESYVALMKKQIRENKEASWAQNEEGLIMEALYKGSEYSGIPQDKIDSFKKSVEDAAAMYGISTEAYLYYAYGGVSVGEQFDELARFQVCARGIFAAIIQREKMKITQAEFDEKAAVIAANYGYDSAQELISEAGVENICNSIFIDEVISMLKKNVKVEVIE